ncbi:MAG: outer membrane beta-barrel protein [Imperialibacter sp.]|uniref:outer membrane beta-barrel protein n=1 Tax=Imperialibacter sp. TaxID=2038411 RepID=UPI0032EF460F
MLRLLAVTSLLFSFVAAHGQTVSISGTIKGANDYSGLPGATVLGEKLSSPPASMGVVTDLEGKFNLEKVEPGSYRFQFQYIGYQTVIKNVTVGAKDISFGDILLEEETTTLEEVKVTAQAMMSEQKGDTSVFNAVAFKTVPDASAEDLVQKMPGIAMVDGVMQAQGENVQRILIDGKPFFGGDVQAALQSLPASVIESIQVFDKKSDQSELTGFDDGERIKTINIITKPNRRRGQFGKTSVGAGTDQRYMAGANLNMFNGDRRVTISGLSNNINILNYSASPNASADSRTQDGIINNNAIAVNFADTWAKSLEVSGSYLYNHRQDETTQTRFREYVLPSDSGQVYSESSYNNATNAEHRVFMKVDYKINDNNRIIWRPSASFGNNIRNSNFLGRTTTDFGPLNQTENSSSFDLFDLDYFNNLMYNHQFEKKGRAFTINLRNGFHINTDDRYRLAENIFYQSADSSELLKQNIEWNRRGHDWRVNASYTEPVGANGRIELEHTMGDRINDSDRRLYDFSEQFDDYTLLDQALSNTFDNSYFTQETELGYQYTLKKLTAQVEVEYQDAKLKNDQQFPREYTLNRRFNSVLPSSRLRYKFTDNTNIELDYRTWTREPQIGQLQDVIDNSNPLQLRTGNVDLNQTYTNRIRTRIRSNNPETNRSMFVYAHTELTGNYIGTSTFIAEEQTTVGEGVVLEKGSQLISPVNLDGYKEFRSYLSYGQPFSLIKSNINFNGGVNYTSRPGLINNELNLANSWNYRLGFSLSSNISENIDFRVATWSRYNVVENSLRPALNNNFFTQTTRLNYNMIFGNGFTFRTDVRHQINAGLSAGFDNSFTLWNMSVGKKLFKNKLGEVSLNVYDILKQNNNIRRNISEIYIEDTQSNVLNRYVMLSFTYNFRHFSVGASQDDFEEIKTN